MMPGSMSATIEPLMPKRLSMPDRNRTPRIDPEAVKIPMIAAACGRKRESMIDNREAVSPGVMTASRL
jgi:hypothetical protein